MRKRRQSNFARHCGRLLRKMYVAGYSKTEKSIIAARIVRAALAGHWTERTKESEGSGWSNTICDCFGINLCCEF